MARSSRRQNQKPLTSRGPELPAGPVDIASGTVELVADVMNHWLRRGIHGWRLDAAYAVKPEF